MRRRDQDRFAGPDIEPYARLAPAWKGQGLDARLVPPPEFQIAVVGSDENRQPLPVGIDVIHAARRSRRHARRS